MSPARALADGFLDAFWWIDQPLRILLAAALGAISAWCVLRFVVPSVGALIAFLMPKVIDLLHSLALLLDWIISMNRVRRGRAVPNWIYWYDRIVDGAAEILNKAIKCIGDIMKSPLRNKKRIPGLSVLVVLVFVAIINIPDRESDRDAAPIATWWRDLQRAYDGSVVDEKDEGGQKEERKG